MQNNIYVHMNIVKKLNILISFYVHMCALCPLFHILMH